MRCKNIEITLKMKLQEKDENNVEYDVAEFAKRYQQVNDVGIPIITVLGNNEREEIPIGYIKNMSVENNILIAQGIIFHGGFCENEVVMNDGWKVLYSKISAIGFDCTGAR